MKKIGRKKIKEGVWIDAGIALPADLYDKVVDLAVKHGRSISMECKFIIEKALEEK
jgi:predicted DNA-binding protein